MALYASAYLTAVTTVNAACVGVHAASSVNAPKIFEFAMQCSAAATNPQAAVLVRPANDGSVVMNGVITNVLPHNPGDPAGLTTWGTTWSTAPTLLPSTPVLRRAATNVTALAGMIWTFPRGLTLLPLRDVVLFNILNNGPTNTAGWFDVEE